MTVVRLTCGACDFTALLPAGAVVLRVVLAPVPEGELMFGCPSCRRADVQVVEGDSLAWLLLVGIRPLELSEPALDAVDRAPAGPRFDWEDLLDWHELLEEVASVAPWE